MKLMILKWANNPGYSEYTIEFQNRYEKIKEIENGIYLNSYNAAKELLKKLNETPNLIPDK